jgi:ABC-type transport system substrate-binding protein
MRIGATCRTRAMARRQNRRGEGDRPHQQLLTTALAQQELWRAVQPNATSNKLLRQAMQYSIDRQRIADTVLLKLSDATELPWFPTSPAYDAVRNQTYGFDLDKAKRC